MDGSPNFHLSMTIFLMVLGLGSIIACESSDDEDTECETISHCCHIPESFSQLTRGFDIATYDLRPLKTDKKFDLKAQLFDFSCDKNRTWMNPETRCKYPVPDQFWSLATLPDSWLQPQYHVYKTGLQALSEMSKTINLTYTSGMFSSSENFDTVLQDVANKEQSILDLEALATLVEVSLVPHNIEKLPLSRYFKESLKQLPDNYPKKKEKYHHFLDQYGTHFFTKADLGFGLRQYEKISSNIAVGSLFESFKKRVYESSEIQTSNANSFLYGGVARKFYEDGLFAWAKSAWDNLKIISGRVAPISDLADGKTVQQNLDMAIRDRLNQAFQLQMAKQLEQAKIHMRSQLETASSRYTEPEIKSIIVSLLDEVDKVSNESKELGEANLHKIQDTIDFHLVVPQWWLDINVCYKYEPEQRERYGSEKFCSGTNPSCAKVNALTDYYKINTQIADGCRVNWGLRTDIKVADENKIFKNLKFCFKYDSQFDGDRCKPGSETEDCVTINSYTESYFDFKEKRRSQCKMAWKLSLSGIDTVPIWLLNARLCIEHYSDDNGYSSTRTFVHQDCANINHWVHYTNNNANRYNAVRWRLTG